MSDKKIAIVDCNNFYVSCERLFNPKIKNKPTVVLSNNDGCVIARSQEIKDMGVKMGQPVFKLDSDVKESMVKFSSNYVLYGDISDRISNILKRFSPKIEIYSIDESFIDLTHISEVDLIDYCKIIREDILKLTGIPVSIGIAPNKTLAKLSNTFAKSDTRLGGVCSYFSGLDIDDLELDEVWGIGRKWKERLNNIGVYSIGQFKKMKHHQVRNMLTIVGLRTWSELNGEFIHNIETGFKKPKMVTSSRSFGRTVWQKEQVFDAIWTFIEDATKKMKSEGLKTREIIIFATTNRFEEGYFVWSKRIQLWIPSNDCQIIWNQIWQWIEDLPIKLWAKAGVICHNLIDENVIMETLFKEDYPNIERPDVSSQMWMTRRDFLSPNWTTDWNDIPKLS
jgi:DNA polymerase V